MTIHEPTIRTVRSMCPLDCPDACSLEVTVEDGRVAKLAATNANPLTEGYLCSKVRGFDRHLYHEKRLRHPLIREGKKGEASFRRASWDEALDLVAERMRAVREKHGGEAILPLAYGGSNGMLTDGSTDELLFGRLGASFLLRTVCAVPTKLAQVHLYGSMQGVGFEDYVHAGLIVVWGTNPHATGIHLVPNIQRAQEAGAKLIVVDPVKTPLAKRADLHVPLRPGTDLPVALALHRFLFESGAADGAFLAEHATGVDVLRERAEPWTLERAAGEAGLEVDVLRRFAELYAASNPAVIRCGWGLERSRSGGSAVCAVQCWLRWWNEKY